MFHKQLKYLSPLSQRIVIALVLLLSRSHSKEALTLAPADIPTNNPYLPAKYLDIFFAQFVCTVFISSTKSKSTRNLLPSPIPCIPCKPGSPPLITGLSAGSTATIFISGNIALSLGMIGALSIVRFRNPVKSPLELVLFFALITIGIGAAVNFKLSVLLTLMINILIFIFFKIENIFNKKNKSLFSLSFEEGLDLHTLEVESKSEIIDLENDKNLKQFFVTAEPKTFNYKIQSINRKDIDSLKENIKNNPNVLNIDINYAR